MSDVDPQEFDSYKYPLSNRFAIELQQHYLDLETLAMILKQPMILTLDLARKVLKALGRLVIQEVERRLSGPKPGSVRLPVELVIQDPVECEGPLKVMLVLYDDRHERQQGWFVWIGSVWNLLWPRPMHKILRGDQIDLDELERGLNDLILRVIASMPMELLAIYVPGRN